MNHLIISREYPPSAYPLGGIGTYVAHIAHLLAEHGETVHVIGQQWAGAPLAREVQCDGKLIIHRVSLEQPLPSTPSEGFEHAGEILRAMAQSDLWTQAFSWQAALLAESLVNEAAIDCIEGQDWEAPLYYFLLRRSMGLGPRRTPPCFVHFHTPTQFICHYNDWSIGRPWHLTMKRLEDYAIQSADAALCPSRFLTGQMEAHYGLEAGSVEHIPLPIGRTQFITRSPEVWRAGTICYFGRMEPRKGVMEWIEAAVSVARVRKNLRFEFIGSDTPLTGSGHSCRAAVEAAIPYALKSCFTFIDALPREELWARLAQARIVVVPSRWENFPNTCVEAMSTGLPVLASPNGGMAEMIEDGRNGWVSSSGYPHDLADALRRALDTPADSLAAMGSDAAAAIRTLCDNERTVERHLEFRSRLAALGARRSLSVPSGHASTFVRSKVATAIAPLRRQAPSPGTNELGGIAVVLASAEPDTLAASIFALEAQSRAPMAIVVDAESLQPALFKRIEDYCRRASSHLMVGGDDDNRRGLARLLAENHLRPLGVAILEAGCRCAPNFVESVEVCLSRNARVGVVSGWFGSSRESRIVIPSPPSRPYQWVQNDVSPASAFRATALRELDWVGQVRGARVAVREVALAVLMNGWSGTTYPAVFGHQVTSANDVEQAMSSVSRRQVIAQLRSRFPQQVSSDGDELLDLFETGSMLGLLPPPVPASLTVRDILRMPWTAKVDLGARALKEPGMAAKWVAERSRAITRAAITLPLRAARKTTS